MTKKRGDFEGPLLERIAAQEKAEQRSPTKDLRPGWSR